MKDPADNKTAELLATPMNKAQRFREKQRALGLRQYAFWLSEAQSVQVRAFIDYLDKREGAK